MVLHVVRCQDDGHASTLQLWGDIYLPLAEAGGEY